MVNVLVTGGAGYIGSHACLALLKQGYDVFVLDSLINGYYEALNRVEQAHLERSNLGNKLKFIKVDLRNLDSLQKQFNEFKNKGIYFEAVIHFAGLKSSNESLKKTIDYWQFNVGGTLNLLSSLDLTRCKAFIFSSSATVYGLNGESPISENCILSPINPYGETKLTVENILKSIFKSKKYQTNFGNLRYFNPIGAHESSIIGENPKGVPNNLFPYVCNVAIGKYENLRIFGKDWPTRDGTCIRDYIHVMDLVEGHIATLNHLLNNKSCFLTLNLGTGKGTTVLELVRVFEEVNKIKIDFSFCDRRDGDISSIYADIKLVKKTIGWSAKRDIFDMCKDGWNWQKNNPFGYKK